MFKRINVFINNLEEKPFTMLAEDLIAIIYLMGYAIAVPRPVLVKPNKNATMRCPFKATSTPIIWLGPQNGKLITYTDGENVNQDIAHSGRINLVGNKSKGEYNLHILNASINDSGPYQCSTIKNGSSFQACFYLTILESPRTQNNGRSFEFHTKIGIPATIKVTVLSGQEPQVAWTTNLGGRLGKWTAIEYGLSKFILQSTISPTKKEHFGIYGIKVRNEVGSILLQLNLQLTDFPVTIQPTDANCNASNQVDLTCQLHIDDVHGWQNHWVHNRNGHFVKKIIGSVNGNKSSIEVKFCDYREEGNYICTWTHSQKQFSASATIRANGPPTLTNASVFITYQHFCLSVSFYSTDENIASRWFRNDKAVRISRGNQIALLPSIIKLNYSDKFIKENGYTSSLCISDFSYFDVQPFSCEIVNTFGNIEYIFQERLINQSYQQLISEISTNQQDTNVVQEGGNLLDIGIPFKFVLIPGCVIIVVVVAVIVIVFSHKRYNNEEVFLEESIRPSIEMSTAPPFPESGYEEIETIPMSDMDIATDEQTMIYEDNSEEMTPSDLENPSGISFEPHDYQDIDESKFEVHTYTQCKTLYE